MRRALPLLLALAALAAGCGDEEPAAGTEVVVTTTILADVVRAVGGDGVRVTQLLAPNGDPHDYEPRPDDVRAVAEAPLAIASGGGIDDWIEEVVAQSGGDAALLALAERVPVRRAEDPHWWHDPRNVAAAADLVAGALARADPGRRATYARNATRYARAVRALDRRIARCMAAVPPGARKLVTDHDAFGYFAARYGLQVIGTVIPSRTTQAQPSARDVARLSDAIRRERVRAVFAQESVNAKLAEALADQTGATAEHRLYGDTLGPAGSDGATYLAMEAHNADAIVRGLTGGRRGCAPAS